MPTTLYTTGYEQYASADSLVAALHTAGIKRLVDVRELPLSRRHGFSKTRLAAALADAGIVYEHVRALGNPYRDLYRAGRLNEGAAQYRAHLANGSREALLELARSLRHAATCILCVEESHEACHRALVAEALRAEIPRLRVVNLV